MFFSQPDKLHSHLIELKFGFVLGCLTQLGVIFTCLETASVEILNFFLGCWFFQSLIFHHLFPTESFLNLVISGVFQRIYPIKVWGSLVVCGLFPGRFLNDFGLSCLELTCLKENLSILLQSWVFLEKAARWLSQYLFRGACVKQVIDLSLPKLMDPICRSRRSLSCNSSPCSNSIVCVLSKPGPTFQARNKVKEGSNNFLPFSIFGLAVKTLCWCI